MKSVTYHNLHILKYFCHQNFCAFKKIKGAFVNVLLLLLHLLVSDLQLYLPFCVLFSEQVLRLWAKFSTKMVNTCLVCCDILYILLLSTFSTFPEIVGRLHRIIEHATSHTYTYKRPIYTSTHALIIIFTYIYHTHRQAVGKTCFLFRMNYHNILHRILVSTPFTYL